MISPRSEANFGGVTPPTHHEGIYSADLYDPYRRIARSYFRVFAIVLAVLPFIIFFGVPAMLHLLASLPGRGDGLLFGREPMEIAPHVAVRPAQLVYPPIRTSRQSGPMRAGTTKPPPGLGAPWPNSSSC